MQRKPATVPLDDPAAMAVGMPGSQEARIIQLEIQCELSCLLVGQREALVLSAGGLSYAEVAQTLD